MVRKINLKESITDKWTRDADKNVYCLESDNYNAYLYVLADQSCPGIQIESEIINNRTGKAEKRFSVGDWSLEKTLPVAKKKAENLISKLEETYKQEMEEAVKSNISIVEAKKIAKELLEEQIRNAGVSLERDVYKDFTVEDLDLVFKYMSQYSKAMLKAIGIQW